MSKLLKNTGIYTIGNILPKAFMFLLLPIYTKYLPPEEYGIVVTLQILSVFLSLLFTFSMDRTIYRLYFDYKDVNSKKRFLGTIAISIFVLSTVFLTISFLFSKQISNIYPTIPFYPFYALVLLDTYFVVFSYIPKTYFRVKQKALSFIVFSLIEFALSISLILLFIVYFKAGAEGLLRGKMISSLLLVPIYIIILFRIVKFAFDKKIFKSAFLFALPGIPIIFSGWIMQQSDRIFIAKYFTLADVGIYSLGYKIAGVAAILIAALNTAYMPYFYELANSEDQVNAKKTLYKNNTIILLVIIIVNFIIALFAKELIHFFINNKYEFAQRIIPLISLSYIISLGASLFNLSIYQKKKNVPMMVISISGALINLLFNFALIPGYGAYGAAIATILSAIFIFIATYYYSKKCYYLPINWKIMSTFFGLAIVSVIVLCYIIDMNFYVQFGVKILICLILLLYLFYKKRSEISLLFIRRKLI